MGDQTIRTENTVNPVGIMQGRLLPPMDGRVQGFPVANWRLEFQRARQAGLYCIEWIFEEAGQEINPLASDAGIAEIKRLSKENSVQVLSVCADYYMTQRLILSDGRINANTAYHFRWLVKQIKKLRISLESITKWTILFRIKTPYTF